MCYRRRYGKKKGRRHKAQHAKTTNQPPKKTCAHSFSTGEENTVGQKERYVIRITHATHFCYASTGPLLLLFEPCRRPTTRTNQGMTHPTPPTTHRKHTHAHARQPHRARPPPTPPTATPRATQRTHTHQDQGEGHPEDTTTAPPHHTTKNTDTTNTQHTTQHGVRFSCNLYFRFFQCILLIYVYKLKSAISALFWTVLVSVNQEFL